MTKEKFKTLKDIDPEDGAVWKHELKEEAIKCIKYGLKYKMNFFKVFCEFHNITEEELRND